MRLRLGVSSDRLEELKIKLGTPGYKASGLTTTPRQCLYFSRNTCEISMHPQCSAKAAPLRHWHLKNPYGAEKFP